MTENQTIETIADEIVDGQQDLFTGEIVEIESEDEGMTLDQVVEEITKTVYGTETTITAYKIAKIVNGVFEAMGVDKKIPTQMTYNYSTKGMINGVKGCKAYTIEQTITWVTKYTKKYV